MRRGASLFLIAWITALGSGALQYFHELDHLRQDSLFDAALKAHALPTSHEDHDEADCPVCIQLHIPLWVASWAPLLLFLGLFIAFLKLLSIPLVSRRPALRLGCRGPPAVLFPI